MGKRKKGDREPQHGRGAADRTQEQSNTPAEEMAQARSPQGGSGDAGRKNRRRFGHN
ncbi:hypothetical protein GCM10010420_50880 [Streptomyces glaucosporus]|uniref:Small hydrophilic protein n=1 Tax=Streptomyces glaucosporus TaxID=284044 RepID=A0ABN3IX45_9ACTN